MFMAIWITRLLALSAAASPRSTTVQEGLSDAVVGQVRSRLLETATKSWELGVATEALLEYSWPGLSVFESSAFPPPVSLSSTDNASDVLAIAERVVAAKNGTSLPLVSNDGSAGDPASIGVAVLLANWTRADASNTTFAIAAAKQLTYLIFDAPQTEAGAISHRADEVQLWADFVYMVPPFFAYFGALGWGSSARGLLVMAYQQCALYRDALRDESGLWRHVTLGSWQDNTHWATGNGWAAAGMLRVLETITHSSEADLFKEETGNLSAWIQEIITTAWKYQGANGTLFNVIDDLSTFADSASTALLASVTYRMATYTNDDSLIPYANKALALIEASIDSQGYLQNTVDPYTFTTRTPQGGCSPESQAFVLLLHAARRDYIGILTAK